MNEGAISSTIHQTKFCLTIENIRELNEFTSPEFLVEGIPWTIQVRKRDDEDGPSLDIDLICVQSADILGWEYAADFSWKLLTFDDNHNADEDYSTPNVYNINNKSYVVSNFIDWADLFDAANNYVKDDKICLEIKVNVADPNQVNGSRITIESSKQCCENSGSVVFLLKVANIDNLMAVRTPDITLRGSTWFLTVFKDSESYLGVALDPGSSDDDTTYEIEMTSKVITTKTLPDPIVKKCEVKNFKYDDWDCSIFNEELISWPDLLKSQNGFVKDNVITLQVKIKISEPDDSEPEASNPTPKCQMMGCAICLEKFEDQSVSCPPCGHIFCSDCIKKVVINRKICPTCNGPATMGNMRRVFLTMLN